MARTLVLVVLLLAVALIHLVKASAKLDVEKGELGEEGELEQLSSTIEELKLRIIRDLRNNQGKNKSHKRTKKSGHRKKKKKSVNRKKTSGQGKKIAKRKKSGQGKKKTAKRKKNIGKRKNKFVQRWRKAGQKKWDKMAKGNATRQICDEQALCQKIRDFVKISNQLRKVKRIIKACALMENKAKKASNEFEATVSSLSSALLVTRIPATSKWFSRSNESTVQDVTTIRDQLKNCTDTVKTKCDRTEVEGCQNETLLTQCEAELKTWLTKFGPSKGSCLQATADCCNCINGIPDVSEQCLAFDKMSNIVVQRKTKCTSGNEEGSFGYCRKLQQDAAVKGPTVAKVHCQYNVTTTVEPTTTTQTPANLTLNVTALEASVVAILDTIGNLTSKLAAITSKVDATITKVDANTEKVDANTAKVDANTEKVDANTAKVDANTEKVDANTAKVDANTEKVDANTVKVDANTVKVDANTVKVDANTVKVDANTVKVDANTVKVDANTVDIAANVAAIALKCDATKCVTLETTVGNVASCLADTSSSDCPAAPSGKVSVPTAITALETPAVFMCSWTGDGTDLADAGPTILAPYAACDVNVGSIVDLTSGKFTVTKAGKYRLTFMSMMVCATTPKKAIAIMTKTTGATETRMARSVASAADLQVTTTIDIIYELAVDDTVHVAITLKTGSSIAGVATSDPVNPMYNVFSGEYISA